MFELDYEEIIQITNSKPPRAYKLIGEGLPWYSRRDLALILIRNSIDVAELWSAVFQGDLTAYDEKGLRIINSFNVMGQNPPGCKYEQITIDNVWYFFYKGEDIKKFVENIRPSANQANTLSTERTSEPKYSTPVQNDKYDARKIAKKYIDGCLKKGAVPSIKEAVDKVKAKLERPYQERTIRNWIKDLFPNESRKPGRRPKKP